MDCNLDGVDAYLISQCDAEEWRKQKMLCNARYCWRNRDRPCPTGGTWGQKFREWYKMSLDEYAYHKRMEKLNASKMG